MGTGKLIVHEPTNQFIAFLRRKKIEFELNGSELDTSHHYYIIIPRYQLGQYDKLIGVAGVFNGQPI